MAEGSIKNARIQVIEKVCMRAVTFKQDLFFRLNVVDIKLAPLRYIKEDIPLIIDHSIKKMNIMFGKLVKGIDNSAIELLMQYDWPGNVRELLNCLEKAFNLVENDSYIRKNHLSFKFSSIEDIDEENVSLSRMISNYERKVIENTLKEVNGVKVRAAELLKISTTTLWRKIKELDIQS